MSWLRHAFAVDPDGPAEPTALQQPVVDWLCLQIARRRLGTPGLVFLEMFRPLNYLGAQSMHFLAPAVWAMVPARSYADYQRLARFLERRGSIEYLIRRIEHFEAELQHCQAAGQPVDQFICQHLSQLRRRAAQSPDETGRAPGSNQD